ncbi:hypothetical protein BKA66DRAFT_307064 [Pyrenochaeta sp. MPI-SDFR-AT-0127]|nr:hypothetical protein BKA66DRAFT_307064 [Pyrenochaeta sp. MPI-SDFR-AT-0127]
MYFANKLVAALACITTVCSAIDLNLWTAGGCGGSKVSCIDAGYANCCTGGAPFCQSGNCDHCVVGNDIYTFNKAGCTGASYGACRAAVGDGCCRSAGGGNTCAVVAYRGNARKVRQVNPDECEFTVRPNNMIYTDHNGTEHSIYIPTGTFETAAQHVVDKDWDSLNEFPVWVNQKYTDADRTRKVRSVE